MENIEQIDQIEPIKLEISNPPIKKSSVKKTILIIFLSVILIGFSIFLYARFIGTSGIYVKEYAIYNDKITSAFDGFKIVHLSDIHYGSTVDEKYLNNLLKKVNELKPDIIVITGDLIDKQTEINEEDKNILHLFLNDLRAVYGKYIIGGNHDYDIAEYNDIITNSNFTHLNNTYDVVYASNDESIFIAGIESFIQKKSDINKTLNVLNSTTIINDDGNEEVIESLKNSKYKILLVHEPDFIDEVLLNYDIDLVLAGHSHNGQVRLPFIGAITTPIGAEKYYAPYYELDDNTDLYISSGIGTSTLPLRLFNRPTFNFYRINKS